MIQVQLDEDYIEKKFQEELKVRLDRLQYEKTFWDMNELCKQTNMSVNTIKDNFFYEDDFPKYKVGGKWYFPSEETREFLLVWLKNN
jgi:hypothetical protein